MKFVRNNDRKAEYRRGMRALASHEPALAMRLLRSAVDSCPTSERAELTRSLYWLAIALRRLGKDGLAIKALSSAQRLSPRGRARDMYERVANDYGMPRASCVEHDDYRAFCSIQIRRYLEGVPDRRFQNQEEIDAVLTVIADAWLRLNEARPLGKASCDEKLKAFRDVGITYPAFRQRREVRRATVIAADFVRGRALGADDRCSCGSGLPYRMCCGRTRLPYEPERG
jgi:tetratricopeptide (TPR) repeat protein